MKRGKQGFRPSQQVAHLERDGRRTLYSRHLQGKEQLSQARGSFLIGTVRCISSAASAPRLPGLYAEHPDALFLAPPLAFSVPSGALALLFAQ